MSPCKIHGSIGGRIVAEVEGRLTIEGQLVDTVTEFRYCGCVTWRQQ